MKINYKRALCAFLSFLLIINVFSSSLIRVDADMWEEFKKNGPPDEANVNPAFPGLTQGDSTSLLTISELNAVKSSQIEINQAFGRNTTFDMSIEEVVTGLAVTGIAIATGGVAGVAVLGAAGALDGGIKGLNNSTNDGLAANRVARTNKALDNLWAIIRDILTWIIAFGEITSVAVCLWAFIKLATAPSHPIQRRNCMIEIIVSIVTGALLGGLAIILNVFYNTFSTSLWGGAIYARDWRIGGTVFLTQYGNLVAGFSGIASLTMLLCMGYAFTKFALSGGNPQKRQQAMTGIITTVLATAGVGGVTTFVSMLTGLLKFS